MVRSNMTEGKLVAARDENVYHKGSFWINRTCLNDRYRWWCGRSQTPPAPVDPAAGRGSRDRASRGACFWPPWFLNCRPSAWGPTLPRHEWHCQTPNSYWLQCEGSLPFHRIPQYLMSSDLWTELVSESSTSGEHNGDEAFEDSSEGHCVSDSDANDRLSASQWKKNYSR